MRKVVYPPMTEVVVHWVDAYGSANDCYTSIKEALEGFKPAKRKTLGHFVGYAKRDGEESLLIASDDDRSPDSPEALGGVFTCPTSLLRAVVPVKDPPKRKK